MLHRFFVHKNIQNKHYYPEIKILKSVMARFYPESVLENAPNPQPP